MSIQFLPRLAAVECSLARARTRIATLLLTRLLLGFMCVVPLVSRAQSELQGEQLAKLREASRAQVAVVFSGAGVAFATFDVPATKGVDAAEAALQFLETYSGLYRITDPRSHLTLSRRATRAGGATIFFDQHHDGVFVDAAQIAVTVDGDRITSTSGSYLTELPSVQTPTIKVERATEIARRNALKDIPDAELAGTPRLVYFNHTITRSAREIEALRADAATHLAWRLNVLNAAKSGGLVYFIDAHSGKILEKFDTDMEVRDRSVWSSSGGQVACGFWGDRQWFNEAGPVSGATPDAEGFTAFNSAGAWYDFMRNRFQRDSYDGRGGRLIIHLDLTSIPAPAAGARGFCTDILLTNNMATLDVLAHELTHLLINRTANFARGISQSGSLNESYADVFAALIDTANWTMGEGSAAGVARDMSNPNSIIGPEGRPFPDDMIFFDSMPSSEHTNANIMDKAAFLMAAGGTQNSIPVTGIGRTKLGNLYFDVLTGFLTNNTNFSTAANITILRARNFATTGAFGFTNADACNVRQAFAAVSVVPSDIDCDGAFDNADPDRDGDTVADATDNCVFNFNPDQRNSDKDSAGDACDIDRDDDWFENADDNCPLKENPTQADRDGDGAGDACDDFDSDGVLDDVDNCPFTRNADQRNTDSPLDPYGDACDVDLDNDGVCQIQRPTRADDVGIPPSGCSSFDNCPLVQNTNQSDVDGDTLGDACDSCAGANSGNDEDNDGIDSACDADDDGDWIDDSGDNCPLVKNQDQTDLNGNGIGTACDSLEKPLKIGDKILINKFPNQWLERHQLIELPLLLEESYCPIRDQVEIEISADQPIFGGVTDFNSSFGPLIGEKGRLTAKLTPSFDACLPGKARTLQKAGFNTSRVYTIVIAPPMDDKVRVDAVTLSTRLVKRAAK